MVVEGKAWGLGKVAGAFSVVRWSPLLCTCSDSTLT